MAISRRRLLRAGTVAAVSALPLGRAGASAAQPELTATPPPEVIALNRMAYGPRPGDGERVKGMGLAAYIEEQLKPASIDDSACDALLAATNLRITYRASQSGAYPAKDALEPLQPTLDADLAELWKRARSQSPYQDWAEGQRPADAVWVATWIRAVHSKRQLLEVLVDFWHNHFNVNRGTAREIAATFTLYDKLIRRNALGNFRTFLEEVGSSVAMMYYLNNVSNNAGSGEGSNENYARELFELHTLGSDNYLRFYDNSQGLPGFSYNGKEYPLGYVDMDVYEAANCFSGWSIANGRDGVADTGEFFYRDKWHDNGTKIVLLLTSDPRKFNIPANQANLKDGRDVYDMLAYHPLTAEFICKKLCRRLIADNPPARVVQAARDRWMETLNAPNQLEEVVRVILTSDEFASSWGQKVKRPFESIVSFLRATGATLPVDSLETDGNRWQRLMWTYDTSGQRLFSWPTPTGHPDTADYWLSSEIMLRRWRLLYQVTQSWGGGIGIDLAAQTDLSRSCTEIVDFWIERLCGYSIAPTTRQELINFMAQGGDPQVAPVVLKGWPDSGDVKALNDRLAAMVQLLACSPDFQTR